MQFDESSRWIYYLFIMSFTFFKKSEKSAEAKVSDYEIISMCQLGDKLAFKELVKRYQKVVYALFFQLAPEWDDINDLSQEVFIRIFRGIHSLKSPHAFKSWLNQIVINIFYDELKKRPKNSKTVSIDQVFETDDMESSYQAEITDKAYLPDELFSNSELKSVLQNAISDLPEQYRTVIVLRELQDLQYEEIADLLNCAVGTVKSRLSRGREKLQELIRPYLSDEIYTEVSKRKLA